MLLKEIIFISHEAHGTCMPEDATPFTKETGRFPPKTHSADWRRH